MRYTVRLILILLFCASVASAQWRPSPYFWQYKGVWVDSLLKLGVNDTTMYPATLNPGAVIFRQYPGDTSFYGSNGVRWSKLGSDPDLSAYMLYSDSAAMLSPYFRTADTTGKWKPLGWFPGVSEVTGLQDSLNDRWLLNGNIVSPGQFLGSTNAQGYPLKVGGDTAIYINSSKQVFIDTTVTMGDYIYNRNPLPGDPAHAYEFTTSGEDNYLIQMTNYSNTGGLANLHFRKARGSKNSPSSVQNGDFIASFGFRGYGTMNFSPSSAALLAISRENFTDSSHGTEVAIQTTAIGGNAWYGRTHTFSFGTNGTLTVPRGILASSDDNVATLSSLTSYANSYIQFNNNNGIRRGYIGMFGTTNQLVLSADNGSTGTPTIRINNRMLVNTTSDNGSYLIIGGSISTPHLPTSGNLTLTGAHSVVRVTNSAHAITLPTASTCAGRVYVIVNYNTGGNVTISSVNRDGSATTSLPDNAKWTVQSDGTNWYVIKD